MNYEPHPLDKHVAQRETTIWQGMTKDGTPIHCGEPMAGQYDTIAEEGYWKCWECGGTTTFDGESTFCDTAVPLSAAYEEDE